MAVVDRMKQAGVPLVLVGAALPRTGGGIYGAAAFLEDPSAEEVFRNFKAVRNPIILHSKKF